MKDQLKAAKCKITEARQKSKEQMVDLKKMKVSRGTLAFLVRVASPGGATMPHIGLPEDLEIAQQGL